MNRKVLVLLLGSLFLLAGLMIASGASPIVALTTLLKGSLGSPAAMTGTLKEMTPLLILGLAVFVALRSGLFNIGAEGQFLLGAMVCAGVCLRVPGPVGIVLGLVAGCFAGALWALPAGLIKAYRNGHEVITTIMLNSVALYFTNAMVSGPLKDPGQQSPTTKDLLPSSRLPWLYDHASVQLSSGLIVGLVAMAAIAFWLSRTVAGYEFQALGANPGAAKYAGVETKRVTVYAMSASGALAGLAGVVQVLAYEGRFYEGISPGYGFDALGVALLAGSNAWGILPASILFGVLAKGGVSLQIEGIPKGITTVTLGLVIVIAAALRYRKVATVA